MEKHLPGAINWLLMTPGITAPIVAPESGAGGENIGAADGDSPMRIRGNHDEASRKFTDTLPDTPCFH